MKTFKNLKDGDILYAVNNPNSILEDGIYITRFTAQNVHREDDTILCITLDNKEIRLIKNFNTKYETVYTGSIIGEWYKFFTTKKEAIAFVYERLKPFTKLVNDTKMKIKNL